MSGNQNDGWVEHLRRGRTEGTASTYKSWGKRFTDWRIWAEVPADADALIAFDDFLSDPDQLDSLDEDVTAESVWNLSRIPSDGYSYRSRVQAISAARSWLAFNGVEFDNDETHNVAKLVQGSKPDFDPTIVWQARRVRLGSRSSAVCVGLLTNRSANPSGPSPTSQARHRICSRTSTANRSEGITTDD